MGAPRASSSPGFGAAVGVALACCGAAAWPMAGRGPKPSSAPAKVEKKTMRRRFLIHMAELSLMLSELFAPRLKPHYWTLAQRRIAFLWRQQTARRDAHAGIREAIDIAVHQIMNKAA